MSVADALRMREYRPDQYDWCIKQLARYGGDYRTHELLAQVLVALAGLGGVSNVGIFDFAPWLKGDDAPPAVGDKKPKLEPIRIDTDNIQY